MGKFTSLGSLLHSLGALSSGTVRLYGVHIDAFDFIEGSKFPFEYYIVSPLCYSDPSRCLWSSVQVSRQRAALKKQS